MFINREKRISNKIIKSLNKRGFIVKVKKAKSTKSIYLTIDNGACSSIRISNHKNSKTNSKFNVINNYTGKRNEYANRMIRKYYNFNMIGSLIADIECERSNQILKYGYSRYKAIRDNRNITQYKYSKVA